MTNVNSGYSMGLVAPGSANTNTRYKHTVRPPYDYPNRLSHYLHLCASSGHVVSKHMFRPLKPSRTGFKEAPYARGSLWTKLCKYIYAIMGHGPVLRRGNAFLPAGEDSGGRRSRRR